MRAIPLERTGPPSVLRVRTSPDPVPGPEEVVVRIRAIGINFAEILSRKGLYGWAPKRPYIPGMEAAGEIESVGAGVAPSRIGEQVILIAQFGCYAERVCVNAAQALPAIGALSLEENAAFAVNYLTAWVALVEMARLRSTDTVLVTAAAGGVGTAVVQLASRFGCRVIAAVGNSAKFEIVRRLGASEAFLYDDLEHDVRGCTDGRGVDVAIELVGGDPYRASFRSLAPFGRLVVAGFASRPELQYWNPWSIWKTLRDMPKASVLTMLRRSVGVLSSHLGYLLEDAALLGPIWRELVAFRDAHDIRPLIGGRFDFEQMPDAHAFVESRKSVGKVVIEVEAQAPPLT